MRPESEEPGEFYTKQTYTMGVIGPYHRVGRFLAAVGSRNGPERILDLMLRTGPYGDGFGARPDGLSFDTLLAAPHGVDLGPVQPGPPGQLVHPAHATPRPPR